MAENLEDRFNKACDHLPILVKKLDSSILLKFYSLYKQASVGPCNIGKPSWYNMEAKSKYNAWMSLENMSKSEAMSRYIQLLDEVDSGWKEKEDEEIDWDEMQEDRDKSESQTKGWVNVSSMVNEESMLEDMEKDVFEWAKEGNLTMLIKQMSKMENFDVNQLDENGLNCLHWACDRGHVNIAQHLVDHCAADVNCKDADGDTALDYARSIEHPALVEYLLGAGEL